MGEVVSFRAPEGQVRKSRAAVDAAGAEILFFTGVRYERAADPEPALAEGDSGAPQSGGMGGRRGGRRRRRG
jgi:hypothetical protein